MSKITASCFNEKTAIDCTGVSMSLSAAQTRMQRTFTGLTLNIVICLNCFSISIDFILGKSWFEAKLIKHGYDQLTVCRWPLGRYFKKKKRI